MKVENQLPVLILISILSFIMSFIFHFCSVFNIFQPSKKLVWMLWIGIMITVYTGIFVSRKITNAVGKKNYKKTVMSVCPSWSITTIGLVWMYAIGSLIFFAVKGTSSKVFPAVWTAPCLTSIGIFYTYRAIKKGDVGSFSSSETTIQNKIKESVAGSFVTPNSVKVKTENQPVHGQTKKGYVKEKKRVAACPKCKGRIYVDTLVNGKNICPHCKQAFMVKGK